MNKKELVHAAAAIAGRKIGDVDAILTAFLQAIAQSVAEGNVVKLAGFGTFKKAERQARDSRNPKTGDPIHVPATVVPVFRASNEFKKQVEGK